LTVIVDDISKAKNRKKERKKHIPWTLSLPVAVGHCRGARWGPSLSFFRRRLQWWLGSYKGIKGTRVNKQLFVCG
jgi:hypothetical protein